MDNFIFSNPVKIIFGKDTISQISNEIPTGSKVMIIYGGGSIKKNGVYDQVKKALSGFEWIEFGGIEVNPHYETCLKAINTIKEEKVTYLLAIGGGSVLDATKFISLASGFDGDPWDIIVKRTPVNKALPLGTILTIFATGSEMNNGGVITRNSSQEKFAFFSDLVYPKFSVLDPTITYSLPLKQVGNGVVDAFVHVIEQYLTYPVNAKLQDGFSEAILRVLIEEGPKAIENIEDYEVRANLMWASSWALNGWTACGVPVDWATHLMGHEITALFGLDHAQTLAIVLPGVMTCLKDQKAEKIIQLGENVFKIDPKKDDNFKITQTISLVEEFFLKMKVKTRLSDYNLDEKSIELVSDRIKERGWKLGEKQNIDSKMVKEILLLRK